jgi:NAD(P)-dependent dehydrogenase (short-subunit alcohol dehydrogenase family)
MQPDIDAILAGDAVSGAPSSRFGFHSTASDVIEDLSLVGKRAVVTGGASGIGRETARALFDAGASITIAVRDTTAAFAAVEDIRSTASAAHGEIDVAALDLTDLDSVSSFAAQWVGPLHILVNNAGVMAPQELTRTNEGFELQFATNHLGHFALALGLYEAMVAAKQARIVAVSSSGHLACPVVFDDLHFRFRDYDPFGAYGQSKTANVLFAVEANRRWADKGITANALHPGGIATRLQRHVGGADYMRLAEERFRRAGTQLKTTQQGAATSVYLATSPRLAGVGGHYFEDCQPARQITYRGQAGVSGLAPYTTEPRNAARLWEISRQLLNRP